MLRRIPTDLPLFGALLLGLSLVAFGFTGMYTQLAFGRPSSTSSLGFFFIPLWGVFAAVAGLILGFVARALWRSVRGPDTETNSSALLATLVCALVAAAGTGAWSVIRYEQEAGPRILFDDGRMVRELRADPGTVVRASTTLYDFDSESSMLSWGRNRSEIIVADDHVVLRDTTTGQGARFSISALDYITHVDAVPVLAEQGPALLAIVISGRATGRRAIVAVVDENYQVAFDELIERFWHSGDTAVEVRVGQARDEYVVVGPHTYESLVLERKPPQR